MTNELRIFLLTISVFEVFLAGMMFALGLFFVSLIFLGLGVFLEYELLRDD